MVSIQDYQWLANFGFAAVVAGYLLYRTETAIKELTKAVSVLTVVVAKQSNVDVEEVKRMCGED